MTGVLIGLAVLALLLISGILVGVYILIDRTKTIHEIPARLEVIENNLADMLQELTMDIPIIGGNTETPPMLSQEDVDRLNKFFTDATENEKWSEDEEDGDDTPWTK